MAAQMFLGMGAHVTVNRSQLLCASKEFGMTVAEYRYRYLVSAFHQRNMNVLWLWRDVVVGRRCLKTGERAPVLITPRDGEI